MKSYYGLISFSLCCCCGSSGPSSSSIVRTHNQSSRLLLDLFLSKRSLLSSLICYSLTRKECPLQNLNKVCLLPQQLLPGHPCISPLRFLSLSLHTLPFSKPQNFLILCPILQSTPLYGILPALPLMYTINLSLSYSKILLPTSPNSNTTYP